MPRRKADAATHVLGYYGIEGFPDPDPFHARLLDTINDGILANPEGLARLEQVFPEYTNANHVALHVKGGLDRLRESASTP